MTAAGTVSPKASARVSDHRYDVYGFDSRLAPYMQNRPKVKKAIEPRAYRTWRDCQHGRRRIYIHQQRWQCTTSESCALGDHGSDGLWHQSVYRYTLHQKRQDVWSMHLMSFYDEKVGGFRHVNESTSDGYDATVNQMATEQAYYALAQLLQGLCRRRPRSPRQRRRAAARSRLLGKSLRSIPIM